MKRFSQLIVGALISVLLLWLLFRNADVEKIASALRDADLRWLMASQIPLWASFFVRVQRWGCIVRSDESASYASLFSATQIGFLINFTIPARIGEIARAYILAKSERITFPKCLAMVALDRASDFAGVLAIIFLAAFFIPSDGTILVPPGIFSGTGELSISTSSLRLALFIAGALLSIGLALVALAYSNQGLLKRIVQRLSLPMGSRIASKLLSIAEDGLSGFSVFRSPRRVSGTLMLSLLTWALLLLSLHWTLRAFSFDFPWYAAIVMQALVIVFVFVPLTPALAGQYHLPIILALLAVVPDANLSEVQAFALVAHLLGLVPIYLMGVACLVLSRVSIRELMAASQRPGRDTKTAP